MIYAETKNFQNESISFYVTIGGCNCADIITNLASAPVITHSLSSSSVSYYLFDFEVSPHACKNAISINAPTNASSSVVITESFTQTDDAAN